MSTQYDVLGIGNAIVDVLSFSKDEFITDFNLRKGTMILIDEDRAEELYKHMGPATEVSGGSAANTLAGVASLGGSASFIGKVKTTSWGASSPTICAPPACILTRPMRKKARPPRAALFLSPPMPSAR